MTSILTNTSALAALQTLRTTADAIDVTQNRISTGKRISTAADGSAVWAVSKLMETDRSSSRIVHAGLNVAEQVVSIAINSSNVVTDKLARIHDLLLATASGNGSPDKYLNEIKQTIGLIEQAISATQFNGVNLLSNQGVGGVDKETYTVLASLDRSYGEVVTKVSVIDVESANLEKKILVELKNIFLFRDDHDSTATPYGAGTPLDEGQVVDVTYANITQDEYANLLTAARIEDDAWKALFTPPIPAEADAITYSRELNAYYDALIKDTRLTDADKNIMSERKDAVQDILGLISESNNLNSWRNAVSTAFHAFDGAVVAAGLKSFSDYLDEQEAYRNADSTGKAEQYKNAYPSGMQVVEFNHEVARQLINKIQGLLKNSIAESAMLGAKQHRIQSQAETVSKLADALTIGIGALIDTNLEEESARLKALQTQQQLGLQALSIANQASQAVLSLFR